MSSPFETLGLEWDADERTVKRAYAKLIKEFRPDSNPVEFARIREAYEKATEYLRDRAYWAEVEQSEAEDDALAQVQPAETLLSENAADLAQKTEKQGSQFDKQLLTQQSVDVEEDVLDIPPYQRLHSERISEAELFRLLDLPEQTIQILPDVMPQIGSDIAEAPLPQDSYYQLINQMLAELGQFKLPQQEVEALACFNAQLQHLDEMSLDARMDYEDALRQWMLYSEQPPLRVFNAACRLFAWDIGHYDQMAYQGRLGMQFIKLLGLSNLYQEMLMRYANFVGGDGWSIWKKLRIRARVDFLELKLMRRRWSAECMSANLPKLQDYFVELVEQPFQLYVVDILFASGIALLAWWVIRDQASLNLLETSGVLIFTSLVFLIIPNILRAASNFIHKRPEGLASKILTWIQHVDWIKAVANSGSIKGIPAFLIFFLTIAFVVLLFTLPVVGQFIFAVVFFYFILVPFRVWYWAAAKVEQSIVNLTKFLLDVIIELEDATKTLVKNRLIRFLIRPLVYVAMVVILVKRSLPKIFSGFKSYFNLQRTLALLMIAAFVCYWIYRFETA